MQLFHEQNENQFLCALSLHEVEDLQIDMLLQHTINMTRVVFQHPTHQEVFLPALPQ